MRANLMIGREVAKNIIERVKEKVAEFRGKYGRVPHLKVIFVGDNPSSKIYIARKEEVAKEVGIKSSVINLPNSINEIELLNIIEECNKDENVDGILVQLPLPSHINERKVLNKVSPLKDVDSFHPYNLGKILTKENIIAPCTAQGILELLDYYKIKIKGKRVVVVGRSLIVGKPVAMLLLNRDATVTICHSKTEDLKEICKTADILIVAVGKAWFINGEFIKRGAVIVDVGINVINEENVDMLGIEKDHPIFNKIKNKKRVLLGDVKRIDAIELASYYTPVPGGVGPMTIAILLENTIKLAFYRKEN